MTGSHEEKRTPYYLPAPYMVSQPSKQGDLFELMPPTDFDRFIELQRQEANRLLTPEGSEAWNKGGSFSAALARRIVRYRQTHTEPGFDQVDYNLVRSTSLANELFTAHGDLSYEKTVVLMPEEYSATTQFPKALAKRLGGNVLKGTIDRLPTEQEARRQEVIFESLTKQRQKAADVVLALGSQVETLQLLASAMAAPGYAHHTERDIDELLVAGEESFKAMLEAVTKNHQLTTERTRAVQAALEFRLAGNNSMHNSVYWKHMTQLTIAWSRTKHRLFRVMIEKLDEEIATRA